MSGEPAGPIKIKRLSTLEDIIQLRPIWSELEQSCPDKHVLLSLDWILNWVRFFGTNKELYFLLVTDDVQTLAIAPLILSKGWEFYPARDSRFCIAEDYAYLPHDRRPRYLPIRRLTFPLNIGSQNGRAHFLVRAGYEAIACAEIVKYLAQHKRDWDIAVFEGYPVNSPTFMQFPVSIKRHSMRTLPSGRQQELFSAHISTGFQDYFSSRSKHFRGRWRADINRCQNKGPVQIKIYASEAIQEGLDLLFSLEQKSWKSKSARERDVVLTLNENTKAFFSGIATTFSKQNGAYIYVMFWEDTPISGLFSLNQGDCSLALLTYFDDNFRSRFNSAPMYNRYIEHCVEQNLAAIDFNGNTVSVQKMSTNSSHYQRVYVFNSNWYSTALWILKLFASTLSKCIRQLRNYRAVEHG